MTGTAPLRRVVRERVPDDSRHGPPYSWLVEDLEFGHTIDATGSKSAQRRRCHQCLWELQDAKAASLLTVQDIADQLDIPYQTAQKRLWRAGIEPTKIIGRSNLYPQSVIKSISTSETTSIT